MHDIDRIRHPISCLPFLWPSCSSEETCSLASSLLACCCQPGPCWDPLQISCWICWCVLPLIDCCSLSWCRKDDSPTRYLLCTAPLFRWLWALPRRCRWPVEETLTWVHASSWLHFFNTWSEASAAKTSLQAGHFWWWERQTRLLNIRGPHLCSVPGVRVR